MRILVVDDEPAVREAVERALRLEGHDVALAADGGQALDALEAWPPDAVVLDVLMPRVDGIEACRRMRSSGDRTPVLIRCPGRAFIRDRQEVKAHLIQPPVPQSQGQGRLPQLALSRDVVAAWARIRIVWH